MSISFQQLNLISGILRPGKVRISTVAISLMTGSFLVLPAQLAFAQNPAMEQKIEEIKQTSTANKQEFPLYLAGTTGHQPEGRS